MTERVCAEVGLAGLGPLSVGTPVVSRKPPKPGHLSATKSPATSHIMRPPDTARGIKNTTLKTCVNCKDAVKDFLKQRK